MEGRPSKLFVHLVQKGGGEEDGRGQGKEECLDVEILEIPAPNPGPLRGTASVLSLDSFSLLFRLQFHQPGMVKGFLVAVTALKEPHRAQLPGKTGALPARDSGDQSSCKKKDQTVGLQIS